MSAAAAAQAGHSLGLFMAASLALNVTPGADMLYVAARSMSGGFAAGVASTLGIATGTLVHITLVACGLAAVLAANPAALALVQAAGAAYLIYLGVRALRTSASSATRALAPDSRWDVFRQGALTNVLNPKVALFFLAFVPQFVDPARGSPALQVIVLGLLFNCSGSLVNLGVAYAAGHSTINLQRASAAKVGQVSGALLIGLGAFLLLGIRTRH